MICREVIEILGVTVYSIGVLWWAIAAQHFAEYFPRIPAFQGGAESAAVA